MMYNSIRLGLYNKKKTVCPYAKTVALNPSKNDWVSDATHSSYTASWKTISSKGNVQYSIEFPAKFPEINQLIKPLGRSRGKH